MTKILQRGIFFFLFLVISCTPPIDYYGNSVNLEKEIIYLTKMREDPKIKDRYYLTFKEIYRILKSNGNLIGSTPFIYPVHGAPNDYYRFTKDFFNITLKKNKFKKIKIDPLGFGPFVASYNLIYAYIKFFPLFKELILILSYILDFTIQLFVKTKLKEIYPIGFYFTAKK